MKQTEAGERIRKLLDKAGGPFRAALIDAGARLTDSVSSLADKLLGRLSEDKRRPVLYLFGGLTALLFLLVISLLAVNSRERGESAAAEPPASPAIPAADLFIPAEPDFLPEFILEREPRSSWSAEDISPYWKNPSNPELWRGKIRAAVDELMEAVP